MRMMLVIGRLVAGPTAPRRSVDSAAVTDLFWSVAPSGGLVQHVHVRSHPGVLSVSLYVMADRPDEAERLARVLCERALAQSPALAGWCGAQ